MDNASNASYPCGLPPDFPPSLGISPSISYVQAAISLTLGVVGFVLNVFVLFIILKFRSLHQRLMYIAVQISVVEIAYSLLVPPALFVSGIARDWLFGEVICNVLGVVNDGFAFFRFMMTLVLTLDRFISVYQPFFYRRNSKKLLVGLHVVVYVNTLLRVILPLTGVMGCYVYVSTNKICTAYSDCSTGCYYLVLVSVTSIILFGAIFPFCMYMVLFYKAYKIRRRSKGFTDSHDMDETNVTEAEMNDDCDIHQENNVAQTQINVPVPNGSVCNQTETENRFCLSKSVVDGPPKQRYRESNRKSLRVTITMFILLMSVIGCTSPAFTLYIIQFLSLHDQATFFIVIMLVGRISFNSIPVVDAIAIMRDKDFRKSTRRFFSSIKCY